MPHGTAESSKFEGNHYEVDVNDLQENVVPGIPAAPHGEHGHRMGMRVEDNLS